MKILIKLNADFIYENTLVTDPFNLSKRNFYYSNYTPPDSHGINIDKTCTNINIDTINNKWFKYYFPIA